MNLFQLWTLFVIVAMPGPPQACSAVPLPLLDEPRLRFSETYANETWGFALAIPHGMTAYGQTSPPYHGVWFVLGDRPHGSVVVSGEANSLEFKTPRAAARDQLGMLRKEGKKIEANSLTASRLGVLSAARMETRYRCNGDPAKYVELYVVALSPHKGPLYDLVLTTTVDRLGEDRAIFEGILRNWKLIGR